MAAPKKVKVALIGSGAISRTYLENMCDVFSILDVVGCSDIIAGRSAQRAEEFGIRQMTNEEIWNDPTIEIVVNTTYPLSHYEVTKKSLEAGKHVQCEKMMAVTLDEAKELMDLAKQKGLRFGVAPDTFLGGGLQTARKLIDDGFIGEPLHAHALVARGYHPRGEAAGPLSMVMLPGGGMPFDMGGYYMHALIHLIGPAAKAAGFAKCTRPVRRFENPRHPNYGEDFDYNTINTLSAALDFHCGANGTLAIVSDHFGETPRLEIYGTRGALICNDPNNFTGDIRLKLEGGDFHSMPLTHGYNGSHRGIGVADMAWAIRRGRPHRTDAAIGYHAFELVNGIWASAATGQIVTLESKPAQPAPLRPGFISGTAQEAVFDEA